MSLSLQEEEQGQRHLSPQLIPGVSFTMRVIGSELALLLSAIALVAVLLSSVPEPDHQISDSPYSELVRLKVAAEIYERDYGEKIESLNQLICDPNILEGHCKSVFVKRSDLIDRWGAPYAYERTSKGGIRVYTFGKDRKPGGKGDNRDYEIES